MARNYYKNHAWAQFSFFKIQIPKLFYSQYFYILNVYLYLCKCILLICKLAWFDQIVQEESLRYLDKAYGPTLEPLWKTE